MRRRLLSLVIAGTVVAAAAYDVTPTRAGGGGDPALSDSANGRQSLPYAPYVPPSRTGRTVADRPSAAGQILVDLYRNESTPAGTAAFVIQSNTNAGFFTADNFGNDNGGGVVAFEFAAAAQEGGTAAPLSEATSLTVYIWEEDPGNPGHPNAPGSPTFERPVRNTLCPMMNDERPAVQLCSP